MIITDHLGLVKIETQQPDHSGLPKESMNHKCRLSFQLSKHIFYFACDCTPTALRFSPQLFYKKHENQQLDVVGVVDGSNNQWSDTKETGVAPCMK